MLHNSPCTLFPFRCSIKTLTCTLQTQQYATAYIGVSLSEPHLGPYSCSAVMIYCDQAITAHQLVAITTVELVWLILVLAALHLLRYHWNTVQLTVILCASISTFISISACTCLLATCHFMCVCTYSACFHCVLAGLVSSLQCAVSHFIL